MSKVHVSLPYIRHKCITREYCTAGYLLPAKKLILNENIKSYIENL